MVECKGTEPSVPHIGLSCCTHQRKMPCYVAVKGPYPWINRVVLDYNMSGWPQHLNVSALGILRIRQRNSIPETVAIVQYIHIVAMEVHRLDEKLADAIQPTKRAHSKGLNRKIFTWEMVELLLTTIRTVVF